MSTLRRIFGKSMLRRSKTKPKNSLEHQPADGQAKIVARAGFRKTGDYATAVAMLEAVPDLVRDQPEAIVALAKSYYRTGSAAGAAGLRQLVIAAWETKASCSELKLPVKCRITPQPKCCSAKFHQIPLSMPAPATTWLWPDFRLSSTRKVSGSCSNCLVPAKKVERFSACSAGAITTGISTTRDLNIFASQCNSTPPTKQTFCTWALCCRQDSAIRYCAGIANPHRKCIS